jgi:uncharacterized membrane protein YeiB
VPTTRRLDGLDAARGLAVVSMLVAHLSPVGGVLNVSEYVTAPLFAVIIGISMGVRLTERRPAPGTFLLDNAQRGLILVLLGVLLQAIYSQVDVVLPYLGVLIIVLAPLALVLHRAPVLTVGLAAALAVVGPIVVERVREAYPSMVESWPRWSLDLVTWLATGEHYRLVSFLPMALGGVALGTVLRRAVAPPEGYVIGGAMLVLGVVAYALGSGTADGSAAYSGTTAEVVGATFLATATVVASFLVVDRLTGSGAARALGPLLATGRLALTAYTLQILWLALLAALRDNAPDDAWWILGSTLVVVVGLCWGFDRRWGTGPLEWVVHRLRPQPPPAGRHLSGAPGRE